MKRILLIILFILLPKYSFAQFPIVLLAEWTPNVVTDDVVEYRLTLTQNNTTPIIFTISSSSCTMTTCTQDLTIIAIGNYNISLVAINSFGISSLPSVYPFNISTPGNPRNPRVRLRP